MTGRLHSIGIDIGSVSVKVVLLDRGEVARKVYRRFEGRPFETLHQILCKDFPELRQQSFYLGLTGIGGRTAQSILGGKFFGEIGCLGTANLRTVSGARTVIEMGGEDSKLLVLDRERNVVADFAMNAQCAAGTGSFLDQQAGRLKISIENEFGRLAMMSQNPPRIAGRCSVFAKSDMIHLQQIATPDYDIVAGLCFAVARNFKSSIARGKKLETPIAFEGGVAANPGMVRAFTEILNLDEGELLIPGHYNVMGALGAAFLACDDQALVGDFDPEKITGYLKFRQVARSGREALSYDYPDSKHYDVTTGRRPTDYDGLEVFLGIDVGSLSTNLALIDRDYRVIARRYLMTEGRPIEAVRRGLAEIGEEVGEKVVVLAVGTTGSGRYLTGDFVGADTVRNEITAQATAAVNIDPTVDTIFEIGGQDSKYISLDERAVIDFEMNKVCAAGTGSFLQEQAEKLNISIENEFGDRALGAKCPVGCGERCTVFMESDLVAHQRSGASKDDLIAGLAYSIVANYLTKVVGDRRIGDNIFFQGGTAWNKAVVAAFERLTGKKITVPPHHDVTGAIGAAILAMEETARPDFRSRFKGFDLYKRQYRLSTFNCEDCPNNCEIHKVEIENEQPLHYGARCEKYDVDTAKKKKQTTNYVALRQKLLYRQYLKFGGTGETRARVGIPRVLHFFEYYPFWRAFFESVDFEVVDSDRSNYSIVEDALELFIAETCYPIKLTYGHIANLIGKKVDYIFMPSLIRVSEAAHDTDKGAFICPYVQTIGASLRTRFDFAKEGIKLVDPAISLSDDVGGLRAKLKPLAGAFGLNDREFHRAIDAGLEAFRTFKKSLKDEGQKILEELGPDEKALVIISRPYNGYDRTLSLDLPDKIRNLGYKAIPVDFLPVGQCEDDLSHMYWSYGKRILSAAEQIRKHPNLFAVYITSFGCGPDSFITHFFRKKMSGKPYLQLELDEHSADAGMITRCEAFVDSLRFHKFHPPVSAFSIAADVFRPFEKTIYLPNMCDHAYVVKAALERCGLTVVVLDEPDELTLEYGKKFTSGKECFPCVVTTGDMIKKIKSKDFDKARSVFFMPGAGGPCRFGLYSQFHRMILDELGYDDIPIYSPHSDDGYAGFGLDGSPFRKIAWKALVFVDCLIKMLHQTRPYEINKGETEKLYLRWLNRLCQAVLHDESMEKLAVAAGSDFRGIGVSGTERPLVGLVGEIYLRNNRFSNNYLIEKLERLGLEVWLATFTEWPLYTSCTYLRDSFLDRNLKGSARAGLQILLQSHLEHRLLRKFAKSFDLGHEYPVHRVMKIATRYLPLDYEGEAILSIGKAMEMAQKGAGGIVNAMPFNCMPGTVVSSLSRKVSEDHDGIPWLNISYEGLRDSGEDTRLEAFAEQVRAFAGQRQIRVEKK
ncbi:MAG: acyl-CoA dehydratase activase [candidate division Zixibacteria bacterium]|nr:acyl-CoA dehydratase activase [candidate division Zixibacteria bacterium]